ncbi:MAG TPA: ferrochelatase [Burkholderiaceae bacterium]|nr:ferrochelatase [Burkholderiaceae bacterium]
MSREKRSTAFRHDAPERTAIVLVQLGTPSAPTPAAVRRYLAEFLSDPRVVELPRPLWWPILHGVVLRTRPRRSAAKYAAIWTADGSPLRTYTERQATLLRGWLGDRGHDVDVASAMRYGEPSLPAVLAALRERNLRRLLVLPLYPQYSGATTASAFDAVCAELSRWRDLPELRLVRNFHDAPQYLDALATRIRQAWGNDGPPQRLVMSFHGMPQRTLELGDPYHCECLATARLLAQRLQLDASQYVVGFQSRFGAAQWLQPYTGATLAELGRAGTGRVDVVCPGFVSDCLETLEEIEIEGKAAFRQAGGGEFRYIGCLNDSPAWIDALAAIAERHLAGWPTRRAGRDAQAAHDAALAARKDRAVRAGARQ